MKNRNTRSFPSSFTVAAVLCGFYFTVGGWLLLCMPYGKQKRGAYVSWKGMITRCTNPAHENYHHYGASGITICNRWKSFKNFFEDMGTRPEHHVLDRIDRRGNYEPSNCRWASFKESTENRGNTIWVEGMRVNEIAERYGMRPSKIYQRLASGWSFNQIISHPEDMNGSRIVQKEKVIA